MLSTVWTPQRCLWSHTEGHSEGHPERYTELHGEEEREEGDRADQEDKSGNQKERETDLASNRFPKCSPQPGTHRDSQSWVEKRRGREEIEATWWRKRRVQRGREQSGQ